MSLFDAKMIFSFEINPSKNYSYLHLHFFNFFNLLLENNSNIFRDVGERMYGFAIVKGVGNIKRSLVWSSALRKIKGEGERAAYAQ